ncbi:Armadillo-like helical [Artemisia annua]|uniref:Armadillo-like helical n=1 Tax=Artemisia annua TaxID=35608 RepID=A0A2U1M8C1_ARTAN|nr:Armadillo-like helical [Artemisia annua]
MRRVLASKYSAGEARELVNTRLIYTRIGMAALKDELTTKKLVCLFSSANSGHAQASVCNIVAIVHPEAAGALRQECMAVVTRCTGLSDNKEK